MVTNMNWWLHRRGFYAVMFRKKDSKTNVAEYRAEAKNGLLIQKPATSFFLWNNGSNLIKKIRKIFPESFSQLPLIVPKVVLFCFQPAVHGLIMQGSKGLCNNQ
jgi:hypothetical protein